MPFIFFLFQKKIKQVSEYIEISIPSELARFATWQRKLIHKYETNQVIKALDTWLLLKHETTSGTIQQWNDQKKDLLHKCKCTDSIFRHRLQVLHDMKLITLYKINRKNDSIKICSWEQLAKTFDIDVTDKFTIQYNINDKQKIHHWIIAVEIQDNKNRQDYSIARKLKKNAEAKMLLDAELIKRGADLSKLKDLQYYLSRMRILYASDFNRLSEVHQELIEIRPDNNRSTRGIANSWNARHAMTASYWKKILKQAGIIDVVSVQIESQDRARNKYCRVLWLKKEKQTLLCLCDQIEILKPWERTDEFKMLFAA